MTDETYNGWTNWDSWECWLVLENTEASQRWLMAWHKNFKAKQKRGVFDQKKAEYVVEKYLIPTARGKGSFYKRFAEQGFVGDENIDPKKVDKAEIVRSILEMDE